MLHVLLKRQFVTTANADSKDLHEKSGIISKYILAETPTLPIYIASVFYIREATQERQSALHKIETYLLLYLIQIIGRRSSSPAAVHDCDLYFNKKENNNI